MYRSNSQQLDSVDNLDRRFQRSARTWLFRGYHGDRDGSRFQFYHEENCAIPKSAGSVTIKIVDERTTEGITYRLPSKRDVCLVDRFPVRELFYTFAEQIGGRVRPDHLMFKYKGEIVPFSATVSSLGFSVDEVNVLTVEPYVPSYLERVQNFTRLNRMGKVDVGIGMVQGIFQTDLLSRIFEFAGLDSLVQSCLVCRHWFHLAQRFSVLVQLQDGDSEAWTQGQHYPILLHDGCRHSFHLAQCQARDDAKSRRVEDEGSMKWNSIARTRKYSAGGVGEAYGYCKAAGCTTARTSQMESISRGLDAKWQAMEDARTAFMNHLKNQFSDELTDLGNSNSLPLTEQKYPPEGKDEGFFITEAVDWQYKNCAAEMYRRYFSPDMFYIFPLIVNSQAAVGLDFTSCHTSLIFQTPEPELSRRLVDRLNIGSRPAPFGAVSWRIHDSCEVATKGLGKSPYDYNTTETDSSMGMINGSKPQVVLEVLFIAVWENRRGADCGSELVKYLEDRLVEYVKGLEESGVVLSQPPLLYVEIGYEQPLAKRFWGNNGFTPIVHAPTRGCRNDNFDGSSTTERLSLPDWQLGFVDRRCLRFKDTEQFGKRVLMA